VPDSGVKGDVLGWGADDNSTGKHASPAGHQPRDVFLCTPRRPRQRRL